MRITGSSPAESFVLWAQGYYGDYQPGQLEDILAYLSAWDALYLECLKDILKRTHPSQYKTPPDIAAMDKCYIEASAARDREVFRQEHPQIEAPRRDVSELNRDAESRLKRHCRDAGVEYMDLINLKPGAWMKVLKHRLDSGEFARPGTPRRIGKPITWDAFR